MVYSVNSGGITRFGNFFNNFYSGKETLQILIDYMYIWIFIFEYINTVRVVMIKGMGSDIKIVKNGCEHANTQFGKNTL